MATLYQVPKKLDQISILTSPLISVAKHSDLIKKEGFPGKVGLDAFVDLLINRFEYSKLSVGSLLYRFTPTFMIKLTHFCS